MYRRYLLQLRHRWYIDEYRFIARECIGNSKGQLSWIGDPLTTNPKGFSYAEIAGHLGLSRQTVPGHIKNIYRKLEVHTRGEAVFEALQQGLIRL